MNFYTVELIYHDSCPHDAYCIVDNSKFISFQIFVDYCIAVITVLLVNSLFTK